MEAQQLLAESSLAEVFEAYDEARAEVIDSPVVFVVDCEDPLGAEIARAWVGDELVDNAIAIESYAQGGDGDEPDDARTTVLVAPVAFELAKRETPGTFPYLAGAFAAGPPKDGVLVISVTSGGASALTAPWDARA